MYCWILLGTARYCLELLGTSELVLTGLGLTELGLTELGLAELVLAELGDDTELSYWRVTVLGPSWRGATALGPS